MTELIKDIFLKAAIPGVIISILLAIIKIGPLTLLTSTSIETKMLSKEKQFLIKLTKYILAVIVIVTILLILSFAVFNKQTLYNTTIALVSAIVVTLLYIGIFILDALNKDFATLTKNRSILFKLFTFLAIIIYIICLFSLTAYYVGTQIFSEFNNESLTASQQLGILLAVIIVYILITITILMPLVILMYKFLDLARINSKNINNNVLFIELEGKEWYLQHLFDKNLFYLSDAALLNQSLEFRFIERSELLKQVLKIK